LKDEVFVLLIYVILLRFNLDRKKIMGKTMDTYIEKYMFHNISEINDIISIQAECAIEE